MRSVGVRSTSGKTKSAPCSTARAKDRRGKTRSAPRADPRSVPALYTAYHDVQTSPDGDHAVVLLGDAAHAMSPQLGQGCNLALMDALVLAECVHAFPTDPARAIATYSSRRRTHLLVYGQATRWLTPFFQGDVGLLGDLRDLFMAPAGKLPFVRKLMTVSMSGTLGSWLGSTLALPPRVSEVPGLPPLHHLMVDVSVTAPFCAVTVTVPALKPKATPLLSAALLTSATAVLLELQPTNSVTSSFEPSENVPVAVSCWFRRRDRRGIGRDGDRRERRRGHGDVGRCR